MSGFYLVFWGCQSISSLISLKYMNIHYNKQVSFYFLLYSKHEIQFTIVHRIKIEHTVIEVHIIYFIEKQGLINKYNTTLTNGTLVFHADTLYFQLKICPRELNKILFFNLKKLKNASKIFQR